MQTSAPHAVKPDVVSARTALNRALDSLTTMVDEVVTTVN